MQYYLSALMYAKDIIKLLSISVYPYSRNSFYRVLLWHDSSKCKIILRVFVKARLSTAYLASSFICLNLWNIFRMHSIDLLFRVIIYHPSSSSSPFARYCSMFGSKYLYHFFRLHFIGSCCSSLCCRSILLYGVIRLLLDNPNIVTHLNFVYDWSSTNAHNHYQIYDNP